MVQPKTNKISLSPPPTDSVATIDTTNARQSTQYSSTTGMTQNNGINKDNAMEQEPKEPPNNSAKIKATNSGTKWDKRQDIQAKYGRREI